MALEDLLKQITDDSERESLAAIAAKYPAIRQYAELGERVKPAYDQLAAIQGADPYAELLRAPQWVKWRTDDFEGPKPLRNKAALEEHERLTQQLVELQGKGDTEMTLDEITAALKDKVIFRDEAANYINKDQLQESLFRQSMAHEAAFAKLTPLAIEHNKKFGETLDYEPVLQYMRQHQRYDSEKKAFVMPDAREAYDAVVAPKMREIEQQQFADKLKAEREAGKAEGRTEAMQAVGQQGIPVDGRGGTQTGRRPGFMERIFAKRDAAANAANGRLGSGQAAQEGLAAHQKRIMQGAGSV